VHPDTPQPGHLNASGNGFAVTWKRST